MSIRYKNNILPALKEKGYSSARLRKEKIFGEFRQNGFPQNTLKHTRGVISMARAYDPNSASSQFFIMHADAPHLDGAYAAFGQVVEGMDVVDEIAATPTGFRDEPRVRVGIKSITLD